MLLLSMTGSAAEPERLVSEDLKALRFDQKVGAVLDLELRLVDESGREIQLRDCFASGPVIMALGYYDCPMLCNLILNATVESLQEIAPSASGETTLVFVSIDPLESPDLAGAKKQIYLKRFGHPEAARSWYFLTGEPAAIRALAGQVGFNYAYDRERKQFAHPSGIIILTPEGVISSYLLGVRYPARQLREALHLADSHRIGSPVQQLLILCSQFMPLTGPYSGMIMTLVRALAVATFLGVLSLVLFSRQRALRKHLGPAIQSPPPAAVR